jgi:dihydrofolate reductase
MRQLIEATHTSLGGEVGAIDWAFPYLDEDHNRYVHELLVSADALLLGRRTYEGLSAAYPQMEATATGVFADFVHMMNALPKYVATTTLTELAWNAQPIDGDIIEAVRKLKACPGKNIIKFGTGPMDVLLLEHRLVDEYHFWLTPVAVPAAEQPLFQGVRGAPPLALQGITQFASGVLAIRYSPEAAEQVS